MPITELVLIRHGESTGNAAAAAANQAGAETITIDRRDADVPLSELGMQQATALGAGLSPLLADGQETQIWSSPYVRAVQTATTSLAAAQVELPVWTDERLRDRELGVLDLLTTLGVANRYPIEAERRRWLGKFYHRPPGGESWADMVLRLRSFLNDLAISPRPVRVIVFCHDAVVVLFRYIVEQLTEAEILQLAADDPVRNVSINEFARSTEGVWRLVRYNDVTHLEREGVRATEHPGEVDSLAPH